MPILVPPAEALAKIDGEPPPHDVMADLRLPFDRVAVVFGARFEMTERMRALLPSWDPTSGRNAHLSYEPWLCEIASKGGAVQGVVLIASADGQYLLDEVLWLVELQGRHVAVHGRRSQSVLKPMLENIAAAVCWGGWSGDIEPPSIRRRTRPLGRDAVEDRAQRPDIHEVSIRAPKNVRYDSDVSGSRRAAFIRRGHWRRSRIGPRTDWEYKWVWIAPTYVGGVAPTDSPRTVYRLPEWLLDWIPD
jgi:hypothetical protein